MQDNLHARCFSRLIYQVRSSESPAAAACLQSGNTVTCSGASPDGFGTGSEYNLTVTVQPDASIESQGARYAAIHLFAGNTVTNNGTITPGNLSFGILGQGNDS